MTWASTNLIVAPILLPLLTAALMLLLGEKPAPHSRRVSTCGSTALGLAIAILLLYWTQRRGGPVRSASTCPATGRAPSASCWCSTGCRP
ncbi:MAG: hypothetical protein LKM38_01860 [Pseudomonas veronii]|nr:hypothetical protein [Pseudomonas veronii]